MADQSSQEITLQSVLTELKVANGAARESLALDQAATEEQRKTRSDLGGHHEKASQKTDEVVDKVGEGVDEQKKTRTDLGGHHNMHGKRHGIMSAIFRSMTGHLKGMKKIAHLTRLDTLRAAKAALKEKLGAGWKGIKNVAAKLAGKAKDILSALLKGLALVALWNLLEYLKTVDWKALYEKVMGWIDEIKAKLAEWGITWETIKTTINDIYDLLIAFKVACVALHTAVVAWKVSELFGKLSPLRLLWASLKAIFFLGGAISILAGRVAVWALTGMFGKEGALRTLWVWIKNIFSSEGKIGQLVIWTAKKLGLFFGETGPLRKLWVWIKNIFGAEGKIGQLVVWTAKRLGLFFGETGPLRNLWVWIKNMFGSGGKIGQLLTHLKDFSKTNVLFGEGSHVRQMLTWLQSFFGKTGKLATMYRTIKESKTFATLFGEGSHLRTLLNWLGSFFGADGKIAQAATWIGSKVKIVKDYLLIGDDAKKGGAISRLFGWIGGMFGSIKDGWKALQKAKWFTVLKSALGLAGKGVSAIMVPLRWLLLPFTWIFGIGAAVWGFIQGFMGKEGVKDERSIGTKMMDGLKGAFKGLLDFFVIDLVVMVEDVMNWFVDKWNNSIFGKVKQFDKFTFGKDLVQSTQEMVGISKESAAYVDKEVNVEDVLKKAGGAMIDKEGWGSDDRGFSDEYRIEMADFGKAIDKLDIVGLAAMQDKMMSLDKNTNVELINAGGIMKRLNEEIKERVDAAKATQVNIDNSTNSNTKNRTGYSAATDTKNSKTSELQEKEV